MLFSLTPRRLETLATLRRLTDQAGEAVHYSLVATGMRISAWTAYDLLRELERMGLVGRRYAATGARRVGRARILFAPVSAIDPDQAQDSDRHLRSAFDRFSVIADEAAAARAFLAEPAADLSLHLGYWMGRLQAAGRQASAAGRSVLDSGAGPAVKLQTVSAMGLGTALGRLGSTRLAGRVAQAGGRFSMLLEIASRSSDDHLSQLADAARRLASSPRVLEP